MIDYLGMMTYSEPCGRALSAVPARGVSAMALMGLLFFEELAARLHPSERDEVRTIIGDDLVDANDELRAELQCLVEIACDQASSSVGRLRTADLDAALALPWSPESALLALQRAPRSESGQGDAPASSSGAPPPAAGGDLSNPAGVVLNACDAQLNVFDIERVALPLREAFAAERVCLHAKLRRTQRLLCGDAAALTPPRRPASARDGAIAPPRSADSGTRACADDLEGHCEGPARTGYSPPGPPPGSSAPPPLVVPPPPATASAAPPAAAVAAVAGGGRRSARGAARGDRVSYRVNVGSAAKPNWRWFDGKVRN